MGFFEKLVFSAKKDDPENIPADVSLETAATEVPESAEELGEVSPEIKEQLAAEMQALEATPKPESDFKRKLRRSAAIAMASLTLTAAAPAFSEAGSRSRHTPSRAIENGVVYVIDSYADIAGRAVEDSYEDRRRQKNAEEAEERRQQRIAEDEARRQRLEAEKAGRNQENYERKQQQDMENQFRREQAEFRGKLNKAIDDYNRQLKDINRSYEAKKLGTPGTRLAIEAKNEMAVEARRNYIQQVIDYKIAYNQPLTEQEQMFSGQTGTGMESSPTQTPTVEKIKQKL